MNTLYNRKGWLAQISERKKIMFSHGLDSPFNRGREREKEDNLSIQKFLILIYPI